MVQQGWFEIDSKGFAANQSLREPWTLVRELVSNAFDENITECHVEIAAAGDLGNGKKRGIWITVTDDGPGFDNPQDIFTLYGDTRKKRDPDVRGRWNSGEKELLSNAREAIVQTKNCAVTFGRNRKVNRKGIEKGTVVRALMPWKKAEIPGIVEKLTMFIPPEGVTYSISVLGPRGQTHTTIERPKVLTSIDATLPTVIDSGNGLRPTKRKSKVLIFESSKGNGWLFELGIPIQSIEAPYHVSVEQKVPLDPNRNMVATGYQKRIYALLLNAVHKEIGEEGISESWISEALQHDDSLPDAREHVYNMKYRKTLLRSSDSWANEEATESGYRIVDSSLIPKKERERLTDFGLVPTGQVFRRERTGFSSVPVCDWTEGMKATARLARWMASTFLDVAGLRVLFIKSPDATPLADYGDRTVRYNLSRVGGNGFFALPLSPKVIQLTLHEICHEKGCGHDAAYRKTLEEVSASAMLHIAQHPEEFRALVGESAEQVSTGLFEHV